MLIADLLDESVMAGGLWSCKVQRSQEQRKMQQSTAREQQDLNDSINHSGEHLT